MFLISNWLYNITASMPCRLISRTEGEPYLERYYVGEWFGVTFYLHRFVQADADEELHDHPWSWMLSLILCGWYLEDVLYAFDPEFGIDADTKKRKWFNFFRASKFHRIWRAKPETWTLFMHGRRIKRWGFLKTEAFLPNGEADYEFRVIYTGYPSSAPRWFDNALSGSAIGRAPYTEK